MLTDKKIIIIFKYIYEGQMSWVVTLISSCTNMDTSNSLIDDNFFSLEHPDLCQWEIKKILVSHQILEVILSLQDTASLPGEFQMSRDKASLDPVSANIPWTLSL
jgi:hypothetical protein